MMDAYAVSLKELSDLLGDDHDLATLRSLLSGDALALTRAQRELLSMLASTRSDALRRAARKLAARIYAESPRAFVERIGRYWLISRPEEASP